MIVPPDAALNVQAALVELDSRLRIAERTLSTPPAPQMRPEPARLPERVSVQDPLDIFVVSADVRRSTNQSIVTATNTAISFDTERVDTGAMWDVADPTKIVFQTPGRYLIGARVRFAAPREA